MTIVNMAETGQDTAPLLSSQGKERSDPIRNIWRRRKRRKSHLLPAKLGMLLGLWCFLNLVVILIGYVRLSHTFQGSKQLLKFLSDHSDKAPYPKLAPIEPEAIAPLGAYFMILGYGCSILIVFYFICLPFDRDMTRLKRSLFRWLLIDFFLIFSVAVMTFSGAFAVIVHDRAHHHVIQSYWQRLFWNVALVMTPALVLSFHVTFWKQAYIIYRSIDVTKHLVFAIKM